MAEPTGKREPQAGNSAELLADRQIAHQELLDRLAEPQVAGAIDRAAGLITSCLQAEGTLFFFGNGGSSADAQHISAEFVGRFRADRRPLAAVALGTNPAVITALANDYGFHKEGFARELEALARRGDVAIAISTSGRSPGVLTALARARDIGMSRVALTGSGHGLDGLAEEIIDVPTSNVALIQEMHSVVGHLLCEMVEGRMGLDR
jgi:D-sedoheptulose 7-phosphate isomerase